MRSIPRSIHDFALFAAIALAFPALPASSLLAQQVDPARFAQLEWTNVGPARGGRSTAVAGSEARPNEYYFGAAGGGLWKTTDGGLEWRPVTDGQITSASVGAVGICEADPDIVYIGTGETQLRGNIQQGDGLYRTVDGGETWEHIGLREAQNIARVRVHPTDCNTAWAAAFGKHASENEERGIYRTTDGGESWTRTLYRDPRTGGVDISVDVTNPDILYAGLWEAYRNSWSMSSGGPGSGLFKSTDGGESWVELTRAPGMPQEGMIGKVGVSVSPVDPDRVYAIIEHAEAGGVYRSGDGGLTWEHVSDDRNLRQRAFYYTRIYADPGDVDGVHVLNVGFHNSSDGGETFDGRTSVPHGDNHDLWISRTNPDRWANANDGGANVSINGGRSWTDQEYPTAQFYRVITTHHEPYHICGAQQDNSTICIAPEGWGHRDRLGQYGYSPGGGESGYIASNPEQPDLFFAGSYGGALTRYDHRTGIMRSVNIWPENPMGQSAEDLVERAQWTFPIVFSHHDAGVLYSTTQKVWRTTTGGESWEAISPDLTRADPRTLGPSGGPITLDQTGVETFGTVFALAPSYHDPAVIWAGSDDGLVHITRDATSATPRWEDVTPPDAPDFVRINTIEASPTTPGKAYVAGIRYLVDDDRSPYIWRTDDYGESWTKIVDGIPADDFVRAVREDPARPGLLYAASERGVYISWDDGVHWQPLAQNLPVVQVSDLAVENDDLVIATHGRSFWVMEDIGILRQLPDVLAEEGPVLYDPRDPVSDFDNGVAVDYYLPEDADEVVVEFLDASGTVIETQRSGEDQGEEEGQGRGRGRGPARVAPSTEAGTHRVRWNLSYPGWTDFEGRIFWAAGPGGPPATPGEYRVRVTVDGETLEEAFELRMNPRAAAAGVTLADLQERFRFAIRVRDRVTDANEAVIRIRAIKEQIEERLDATESDELEALAGEVEGGLSGVEEEIYQVRNRSGQDPLNFPIKLNNKLAALLSHVSGAENRPTEQSYTVFEKLDGELATQLEQLELVIRQDVERLNEMLRSMGLDPIRTENLITE
ncbi:MAG: hypothetical protein RQ745_09370 [Longimicrobiales bacterium]|nr:hypothetical protein [Longimicrobiales bacterium]